jgi:hypothetical protein
LGRIQGYREEIPVQPTPGKPDSGPANANKRLATRLYQLKTGRCLTGQYLAWTKKQSNQVLVVSLQDPNAGASLQVLPALETLAEDPVGGGAKGDRER